MTDQTPWRLLARTVAWTWTTLLVCAMVGNPLTARADEMLVLLHLEAEPLAALVSASARPRAQLAVAPDQNDRKAHLMGQQARVIASLPASARVTARFWKCANVLCVRVPAEELDAFVQIAEVTRVQLARHYRPLLDSSIPFIRTTQAWSNPGLPLTGNGIRIGIIDTGIDYLHADFGGPGSRAEFDANDSTTIEPGSFPTPKVAGGFDFVGDDFDSSDSDHRTGFPDPDPLDTRENGHGTHVAGIAAGFGVRTNGTPYSGPYDAALDPHQFLVAPGVAPEATLYALKVFGRTGTTSSDRIVAALEWAIDPDDDGNLADRLDVVNLSLGTGFGVADTRDAEQQAIRRLTDVGGIVVVAAGNAGNTYYSIDTPGVAPEAITVANSIDNGTTTLVIQATEPAAIAGNLDAVEGALTPQLDELPAVHGNLAYADPPQVCEPLRNASSLNGRIALADRGTCFFADKILKLQTAGAIAVVIVNDTDGPPIVMGGQGDPREFSIPAIMISKADGERLKAQLSQGATVSLTLDSMLLRPHPELADQIEEGSSRGPAQPGGQLKPDLSAPGTSILSARAGFGTRGIAQTGTSMSSPHVAGAAALLRQKHPTWPVADIKAALMNTAVVIANSQGHRYPETRAGAGRLDVLAALTTEVLASADGDSGEISMNLGTLHISEPYRETRHVRLINQSEKTVTLTAEVTPTLVTSGFKLVAPSNSITLAPHSDTQVEFSVEIAPAELRLEPDLTSPLLINSRPRYNLFEASGQIWFRDSTLAIHLPYLALVRPIAPLASSATEYGTPLGDTATAVIAITGVQLRQPSLASLFVLGYSNGNSRRDGLQAAGDLLAAGAASDFASAGSIEQTRVYFGFGVAGNWTTPQRVFVTYDIDVDIDDDDRPDYTIVNGTGGTLDANDVDDRESMNDALLSVIQRRSDDSLLGGGILNGLGPSGPDTAPYQNSVLVLSAPAVEIGLTTSQTRFRYRVNTSADGFSERSAWIVFDAAKPVFDSTVFGIEHSPFQTEPGPLKVSVHRTQLPQGEFTFDSPPRLLLLHHHGPVDQRVEIVRLNLQTEDVDRDGFPDAWEAEFLGTLAENGADDSDGDGFSDRSEFVAGTDPHDPESVLRLLPPGIDPPTVRWASAPGRRYVVERTGSLSEPFAIFKADILATPPMNTIVDLEAAQGGLFYYRLRLISTP